MRKKIIKELFFLIFIILSNSCNSYKKINTNRKIYTFNNVKDYLLLKKKYFQNKSKYFEIKKLIDKNTIYFESNSYYINPKYKKLLDIHVSFLRRNPSYTILVEGHSDERGTSEYNVVFGEKRANSVKLYLQSRGIPFDRIKIISYGKEKPCVLGHSELSYSKNRRVVLVY